MKSNIDKIFEIFKNTNPNPTTELNYHNNFTLLVAVVLSAQATDKSVNIATEDLFKKYNTPEQMKNLGVEGILEYIKSINFCNNKAKNIFNLCNMLIDQFDSKVPDSFEKLIKLPGVGRKTADVVLNTIFNKNTIAVDTHIFRVAKRMGIASGKSRDAVADELLKNIPKKYIKNAHHWLILHGRYTCRARKPGCQNCQISKYCTYEQKTKT